MSDIKAHRTTHTGGHQPTWRDDCPPDIEAGRTTGRLRGCTWCGSMHPADLAAAIHAGATLSPADRKYGWPHKFYANGVPNPHAGMLESRMSASHVTPLCPKTGESCVDGAQGFHAPKCACMRAGEPTVGIHGETAMVRIPDGFSRSTGKPEFTWTAKGEPAKETTWGKFYTEHLMDATDEDREVIQRAMGLRLNFASTGHVSWEPFTELA